MQYEICNIKSVRAFTTAVPRYPALLLSSGWTTGHFYSLFNNFEFLMISIYLFTYLFILI